MQRRPSQTKLRQLNNGISVAVTQTEEFIVTAVAGVEEDHAVAAVQSLSNTHGHAPLMSTCLGTDNKVTTSATPRITLRTLSVSGRLSYFLSNWETVTNDRYTPDVIKNSYKILFVTCPPLTTLCHVRLKSGDELWPYVTYLLFSPRTVAQPQTGHGRVITLLGRPLRQSVDYHGDLSQSHLHINILELCAIRLEGTHFLP